METARDLYSSRMAGMASAERLQIKGLRLRDNPLAGPLGRRLLAWFLMLSLLPLVLSNMLGYVQSQALIERLVERKLGAIAEAEAQHVEDQIERSLLDLQAIAAGNEFLAAGAIRMAGGSAGPMGDVADRSALERHLSKKLNELRQFGVLFLQRPDGSVAAFAGTSPPDVSPWTRPAPVPAFETLGPPARDGTPRFRLTVPVEGPAGDLVGYLGGVVGQEGLAHFLEIPEHLAGSIESFIVDGQGRPLFVSHPHGPIHYAQPLETPLLAAPATTFARYVDRHGVEVIGTSLPVGGRSWRYIAEFPVADALGPLRALRRLSLLLGGVFAVGVIGTAWLVAGGIVAPIGRLVEAARRVGRGDLEVSVEVQDEDEIGELGRAFNEMTGALSDASARVRELHRREIERAQQLATVGELASGVAHEIKNPVVGIANGLDLVRRHVKDDEQLAPIMEEMTHQLARIEIAVRDLLSFARPATPKLAPADAERIGERAVRLVQPAAERAGVSLELESRPALPALQVDAELVGQALVNLLMNAVQATSAGGHVGLLTDAGDGDGTVRFLVSDTGRGIPVGELESIFKPFFTTRHSGSGLGLSITREIVERHGGRVEVESRLGAGSTFTVILPVRPGAEAVGDEPAGGEEANGEGVAAVAQPGLQAPAAAGEGGELRREHAGGGEP